MGTMGAMMAAGGRHIEPLALALRSHSSGRASSVLGCFAAHGVFGMLSLRWLLAPCEKKASLMLIPRMLMQHLRAHPYSDARGGQGYT